MSAPQRPRILIVDDEPANLRLLEAVLGEEGYETVRAGGGSEALQRLAQGHFDAAVVDLRMPDMDGLQVLREIRVREPGLGVLIATAFPELETAVEALREGAADYLSKPLNLAELRHRLAALLERRFLRHEVDALRGRLGERSLEQELIGASPAVEAVRKALARAAPAPSPVLIEGESGTGKEVAAAALHRLSGRQGPFIPVSCGALPRELMESEFFGHVRGAFSGAVTDTQGLFRSAQGGTLFLDEIGELPADMQTKLLRVLQEKEVRPVGGARIYAVDARIVAATNRDLEQAVRAGGFRQDLFFRLNVVRLRLPPLRDRREDVPLLVARFLTALNQRFGRNVRRLTPEAAEALAGYDFPGNVRELENVLERAYALGADGEIGLADLPLLASGPRASAESRELPTLADLERELIQRALRLHGDDRARAARAIGLSPRTLYRRLKEFRLD